MFLLSDDVQYFYGRGVVGCYRSLGREYVSDVAGRNDCGGTGNRYTVPVGLGLTKTIRWGKMPIKLRLETHYSVIRPDDFGNEWVIRFQFTPVIPNPFK